MEIPKEILNTVAPSVASNEQLKALRLRECAIKELIDSEKVYVEYLNQIVSGYMVEMEDPKNEIPLPDDLKGSKKNLIFNNINDIYEWHRDFFLKGLQNCLNSPTTLGPLINRSQAKFNMYSYYCSNHPLSEFLVEKHKDYFNKIRQKLGYEQYLPSLLIKPVQRLPKYEPIIKEISKYSEKAGLQEDLQLLEQTRTKLLTVSRAVDNMRVVLEGLEDFGADLTAQGRFLRQGPLICKFYGDRKKYDLHALLFQQIIIFAKTKKVKGKFSNPEFKYRSHIQLNKMEIEELGGHVFSLKSMDPTESDVVCEVKNIMEYSEWVKTLKDIVDKRNDFIARLTEPKLKSISYTK
ncbi:rho guanine nucleotide exchange factor 25-like [Scaptodrosophila lebanonensis]|uniref:Rho guanine nucleotide exchange factor 25-like n=1 Tax=Drosophila lebanonensis TaxID=7225 RepID=A0A6J2UF35_DROLE|nr:rho guanine nucleotide exchange factor 25-like [Scaptodrosophila lebanonensis]